MNSVATGAAPRYFAGGQAWLEHAGWLVALDRTRPHWAVLNGTAAWMVERCQIGKGRSLPQITSAFEERFGPVSSQEMAQWLAKLEAEGLLVRAEERPAFDPPLAPNFESYHVEHLYLELLARCNLRCVHCYMAGGPNRAERLETDEVLAVLGDFRNTGGTYVTLAGGEPLIYPEFPVVAGEVARLGLRGSVITNGTHGGKHLALIDELGFNLAISLDGITPQVQEAIRGKGTWPLVMATIDRALAVLGPDRFILSFTPMKANLDDLPGLIDFAHVKGIRRLNLSLFEEVGRAVNSAPSLRLSNADRMRIITIAYERALELIGEVEIDFNDTRNILARFAPDWRPEDLHPLWRGVRINSSGEVYPSSFTCAEDFRLGNIRQQPLPEILRSPVLRELYEALQWRLERTPQCRACSWGQICRGGSPTSAWYATGQLFAPDAYCAGYLKTFPEVVLRLADLGNG
jgi:radical SAM protein with 4Fe4S-binding SPASM domain